MVWPFKRKQISAIEKLASTEWACAECEDKHVGMFDLGCFAPDPWDGPFKYQANSSIALDRDFLSEDFCVLGGEHFLVRCIIPIPVHGLEQGFSFGVWGSLARENFEKYLDHFDNGEVPDGAPFWSWLCNRPKPYNFDDPAGCWMHPQAGRQRPKLKLESTEHPLAIAQNEGISPEELVEIFAANGHTMI